MKRLNLTFIDNLLKKTMKRKGNKTEKRQRVIVLETGELGTVTDRQLIPRQGKLHVYNQVRIDQKPHLDRWFWDDQLGRTRETCRVTFKNEDGQTLIFNLEMDYEKGNLHMDVSGKPGNLKEHNGLHALMASNFVDGIVQHT